MKKGISLALALALALGLTACSTGGDDTRSTGSPSPAVESPAAGTEAPSAPETVTITSLNADKEAVELEVPACPPSCWASWLFRAAIFWSTLARMVSRKVSFR